MFCPVPRAGYVVGVQASIIEGNLDINIDGISDGDAEGNDKTGADGKDGEDEFLISPSLIATPHRGNQAVSCGPGFVKKKLAK